MLIGKCYQSGLSYFKMVTKHFKLLQAHHCPTPSCPSSLVSSCYSSLDEIYIYISISSHSDTYRPIIPHNAKDTHIDLLTLDANFLGVLMQSM